MPISTLPSKKLRNIKDVNCFQMAYLFLNTIKHKCLPKSVLSTFAKSSKVFCLLYKSTSTTLPATNWRWSPNYIFLLSIWITPLIASQLAVINALHSAQFPLLWYSGRPIHHLKLWVSPLPPTSFNHSNSLYCLCVNASLPIRCQNYYLTSATTRHWTPCVLTCNYWTVPLL